jgi:hypothetical protein
VWLPRVGAAHGREAHPDPEIIPFPGMNLKLICANALSVLDSTIVTDNIATVKSSASLRVFVVSILSMVKTPSIKKNW